MSQKISYRTALHRGYRDDEAQPEITAPGAWTVRTSHDGMIAVLYLSGRPKHGLYGESAWSDAVRQVEDLNGALQRARR